MKLALHGAFCVASFLVTMGGLRAQSITLSETQTPARGQSSSVQRSGVDKPTQPTILRYDRQATLEVTDAAGGSNLQAFLYALICIPIVRQGGFPTVAACVTCLEQECIG